MPYCKNCGSELQSDNRFCIHCGAAAEQAPAAVAVPPAPSVQAAGGNQLKNLGRIAAIVALVSFLLPWVSCEGQSATGINLASNGASGLWLIVLGMGLALAVLFGQVRALRTAAQAARTVLACGALSVIVLLYYYARFNGAGDSDPMGLNQAMRQAFTIRFGAILALLGSAGVTLAGFLNLKQASHSGSGGSANTTAAGR